MKGKAKSRFNYDTNTCEFSIRNSSWCDLPKFKRCADVLRCVDGSKACGEKL